LPYPLKGNVVDGFENIYVCHVRMANAGEMYEGSVCIFLWDHNSVGFLVYRCLLWKYASFCSYLWLQYVGTNSGKS